MKYLITGVNGQLGYDINKELNDRGYKDILVPSRDMLDITDKKMVEKIVLGYKPDIIFHCAAYTAVDKAEDEKEKCYDINVNGTYYLVDVAKKIGAKIIYISTDYVFDGTKDGIYEVDDSACPVNYYGMTKFLGEREILKYNNSVIVRISWVFGINGKNFIKTMLRLATTNKSINVIDDQVGSPTYTKDLARLLVDMALSDITGIYHATNEGYCSWYEFAKYIFEVSNIDIEVKSIKTTQYKTRAKRPMNSRLSKDKLDSVNLKRLPNWQDAVKRYLRVLEKESDK